MDSGGISIDPQLHQSILSSKEDSTVHRPNLDWTFVLSQLMRMDSGKYYFYVFVQNVKLGFINTSTFALNCRSRLAARWERNNSTGPLILALLTGIPSLDVIVSARLEKWKRKTNVATLGPPEPLRSCLRRHGRYKSEPWALTPHELMRHVHSPIHQISLTRLPIFQLPVAPSVIWGEGVGVELGASPC